MRCMELELNFGVNEQSGASFLVAQPGCIATTDDKLGMAVAGRTEIKAIIADLVAVSDLAQLTPKVVREHVRKELGDGVGEDSILKPLVRELINEVLENRKSKTYVKEDKDVDVAAKQETPPAAEAHATRADRSSGIPVAVSTTPGCSSTTARRKRKVFVEEEGEEEESAADSEVKADSSSGGEDQTKDETSCRNKDGTSETLGEHVGEATDKVEDFGSGLSAKEMNHSRLTSSKVKPLRKQTAKPRHVTAPSKRAKKQAPKAEGDPKLHKLIRIAREIGCPIPPGRLRCEASEKLNACHVYLQSKGVNNVLLMDRQEISTLKIKFERDRELAGLDASNILDADTSAAGRRPRRAAAPPSLKEGHARFDEISDDDGNEESSEEGNDSESDFENDLDDEGED
jgi:hypothetical protein